MAGYTVLYDANVLFPARLRSILIYLASAGLFRARWTERIHDEWINAALAQHPELEQQNLERIRKLMNMAVPDCLVTGYELMECGLVLPDEKDRHVFAAAIRANAEKIITFNLKDFPSEILAPYQCQAQHPDDFISELFDLQFSKIVGIFKKDREHYKSPPYSAEEYVELLRARQLVKTAAILETAVELL